jgi:EmrB/QacA subfamily drug resistance transporter
LDRPTAPPANSTLLLIAVTSLGAILAPLNSTMVAVALPDIRDEFSLSHGAVAWLVSAYLIAMAVVQPLGGRLGDQIGRARVYRTGLIAFGVLSVITPFSPNFAVLVTLRVLQAVAGAVLMPNAMALIRMNAPPNQLGRLSGINGGVLSFAAAVGPLVGAAVLAVGSWRWLFPISVPFIIAALVLLPRLNVAEPEEAERAPFDWIGTALFVALLTGVTLLLGQMRGGDPAEEAALIVVLAVVAALFVWRQFNTNAPSAEWRLFRTTSFAAATAYTLLTNLTMYTTLLMLPFFVREVQDRSTELSGVLLGAMSVLVAVTSPFGGRLSDAWGRRPSAQLGSVLMLIATVVLLAGLSESTSTVFLAGCLALMGLGLGLGVGAAGTAAIESAPREYAGSASGTSSMMRYVGSIVGAGILAGVLSSDSAGGDVDTFRLILLALVSTSALAVVSSMFIHRFVEHATTPVLREPSIEPV